jgi:hypothetical protein
MMRRSRARARAVDLTAMRLLAALLAAAFAALLLRPAAGQGEPPPADTAVVTITMGGQPVEGVRVRVLGEPPGGVLQTFGTGHTDETGRVFIDVPFRPGLNIHAEATYDGVRYESEEARYSEHPDRGLALSIEVFDRGEADPTALSFLDASHLLVEIKEGELDITEVLLIHNGSGRTFAPQGGLKIPLPQGARNIRGVGGEPVSEVEGGASVPGPFLPGESRASVRFSLPFSGDRVDFRQPLAVRADRLRVIVDEVPGMEVVGQNVLRADVRESDGRRLRLVEVDTSGGELRFSIQGLPHRANHGRWVASALAAGILILGFVFGAGGANAGGHDENLRKAAEAERAEILAELEQLEIDRAEGVIDEEDYVGDKEHLLGRLTTVLRSLEDDGQGS